MRLALSTAALLGPALVAAVLVATRGVAPLSRAQRPEPDWLAQAETGAVPRRYTDRAGRVWWRFDLANGAGLRIAPPGDAFPEGCEAAWFVRRGVPLRLRPAPAAEPLPFPARVRADKVFVHRIAPASLRSGASLEVPAPAPRESVFVSFSPARVGVTEAGFADMAGVRGIRRRTALLLATLGFAALFAELAARYRASGARTAGAAAIAAAFALAALWFDSPSYSRLCLIDKGDDSYYLAYAQNIANHGDPFRFPARIRFGAGVVDHAHGMPGIALMLSPPLLVSRALPAGRARRGEPVTADELRMMRATSAAYAVGASWLLFATMRRRRGGTAAPSAWDVALPALLLWGTSLTRWAFVRSLFTHPAELFLLCLALCVAAHPAPRRTLLRDCLLAAVVGLLTLVRGEYLLVGPLFLLLPRRTPAAAGRTRLVRVLPPLAILAAFALVYLHWTSHLATGYGRPSDAGLPSAEGPLAVALRIAGNARTLLDSFAANGGLLPVAGCLGLGTAFLPGLRRRAADLPFRPLPLALLAALLFLLNACFTPPLGDEFQHRYALKLYPFALLWLDVLLAGPRPAAMPGRAARALLAAFPAVALAANLRLLLRIGGTDLGQNFSLLTDLQLQSLPPSGSGAMNLRLAQWLLLAAWAAWLAVAIRGFRRTHPASPPTPHESA